MSLDRSAEERFLAAMGAAGWRYEEGSAGFRQGDASSGLWVSWEQAQAAYLAAEQGRELERREVRGESETIARSVEDMR